MRYDSSRNHRGAKNVVVPATETPEEKEKQAAEKTPTIRFENSEAVIRISDGKNFLSVIVAESTLSSRISWQTPLGFFSASHA